MSYEYLRTQYYRTHLPAPDGTIRRLDNQPWRFDPITGRPLKPPAPGTSTFGTIHALGEEMSDEEYLLFLREEVKYVCG